MGYEIITQQTDNRTLPLTYYLGENNEKLADFIFKKGEYYYVFIVLKTTGLPNGVIVNLVDENLNQLYSPIDANQNYIKTQCSIVTGETDAIPLPADYNGDTYEDFEAGVYHWNLYFAGNDYYNPCTIPLTVEIRDFNVWEVQNTRIFPNQSINVKIRSFLDTIYSTNYIEDNASTLNSTYNESTGIITYPNSDITDLTVGQHTQVINQPKNYIINYEIKNPIRFYCEYQPSIFSYGSRPYPILDGNVCVGFASNTGYPDITSFQVSSNSSSAKFQRKPSFENFIVNGGVEARMKIFLCPPGTYNWTVTGGINGINEVYTVTGTTQVTTNGCSITLDKVITDNNVQGYYLEATYLYNESTPIPDAYVEIIDIETNIPIVSGTTDSNGKINTLSNTLSIASYKAIVYDACTYDFLLESDIYSFVIECDIITDITFDNGVLNINKKSFNRLSSTDDILVDITSNDGDIDMIYSHIGEISDINIIITDVTFDNGVLNIETIGDIREE